MIRGDYDESYGVMARMLVAVPINVFRTAWWRLGGDTGMADTLSCNGLVLGRCSGRVVQDWSGHCLHMV